MTTIHAIFENGLFRPMQPVDLPDRSEVEHDLRAVHPGPKPTPGFLTFGKYQSGTLSTLEDFQDAEWHREGEPEVSMAKNLSE